MKLKLSSNKTLHVLILFCILTAIFFYKPIFVNRNYLFVSDLQLDFVTQFFAASSIQSGEIPLWDPYYYGPFIAYYNSAVFYPLNIIAHHFYNLNDLNFSFSLFINWKWIWVLSGLNGDFPDIIRTKTTEIRSINGIAKIHSTVTGLINPYSPCEESINNHAIPKPINKEPESPIKTFLFEIFIKKKGIKAQI